MAMRPGIAAPIDRDEGSRVARRLRRRNVKARLFDALDPEPVTIGRYRVRECIGSGAMGRVFRAYDPVLGRDVAVKLLHRLEPDAIARLIREARAMAALAHAAPGGAGPPLFWNTYSSVDPLPASDTKNVS